MSDRNTLLMYGEILKRESTRPAYALIRSIHKNPWPNSATPATTPASPSYEPHSYKEAPSGLATATAPGESGSAHTIPPHATPTQSAATCPSPSPPSPPRCNPVPLSPHASHVSALVPLPPHPARSSPSPQQSEYVCP